MDKNNILNPLVSLCWRRRSNMLVSMTDAQALWLHDRVYLGGGNTVGGNRLDDAQIFIYTPSTDVWEHMDTPVFWYTPCSYHSALVLIGGVEVSNEMTTNKLYVWSGQGWEVSQRVLPSMPTPRSCTSALNFNENLLVAGGLDSEEIECAAVEIFNGNLWNTVQSLPRPSYWMRSTVYNGKWCLMGGLEQDKEVFSAPILLLFGSTVQSEASVWTKLTEAPFFDSCSASFGNQLISAGGAIEGDSGIPSSAIHAYSSQNKTWIYAGDMKIAVKSMCAVTLPTGELILFGGIANHLEVSTHVYIGELQAQQFRLDGHFTMGALSILEEAAGIYLMTSLGAVYHSLQMKLEISLNDKEQRQILVLSIRDPIQCARIVINSWLAGRSEYEPTWRNLLVFLRSIRYNSVAQQIEKYFGIASVLESPGVTISSETKAAAKTDVANLQQLLTEKESVIKAQEEHIASVTSRSEQDIQQLKKETEILRAQNEKLKRQLSHKNEGSNNFRGVQVSSSTSVTVHLTNSQQLFEWAGFGLKIHIPEGCLPKEIEECTISIDVSFSGQFNFPEKSHLVSALYWFRCTPKCQFTKALSVEIQHCAKPENLSRLSFVRANCEEEKLPYTFNKIEGGLFSEQSSYGYSELEKFSGVGITQDGSEERQYCASLYYFHRETQCPEIDFSFVWNTEAHIAIIKEHYHQEGAISGPQQVVEFEKEMITLDIPLEGVTIDDDWKLIPLMRPVVTKRQVDSFKLGCVIPACRLQAFSLLNSETSTIPKLMYQIVLLGARHPFNMFTIIYIPPGKSVSKKRERNSEPIGPPPTKIQKLEEQESKLPSDSDLPQLKVLLMELQNKVASRWMDLGIFLDIEIGQLENLKSDEGSIAQNCLREMLRIWLKRADPPPTWKAIVEAIKAIGDAQLASDLQRKYLLFDQS